MGIIILSWSSRQTTRRCKEGGAWRGSGRLCRAAGMGESLCWLRGELGLPREPLDGVGRTADPLPLQQLGLGSGCKPAPTEPGGIKPLPGPRGLMVPLPRGMVGRGAQPRHWQLLWHLVPLLAPGVCAPALDGHSGKC